MVVLVVGTMGEEKMVDAPHKTLMLAQCPQILPQCVSNLCPLTPHFFNTFCDTILGHIFQEMTTNFANFLSQIYFPHVSLFGQIFQGSSHNCVSNL